MSATKNTPPNPIDACVRDNLEADALPRPRRAGAAPMHEMLVNPTRREAAALSRDARGRRQPEQGRAVAGHQPQHPAPQADRSPPTRLTTQEIPVEDGTTPPAVRVDKTGIHDRPETAPRRLVVVHRRHLRGCWRNGLPVTEVARHTGFPEMMDGRVKTLHPKSTAACWRAATCLSTWPRCSSTASSASTSWPSTSTLRGHRGQARLHAGRRDREHRHRRPGHGAQRRQELEGRDRPDR